MKRLKDNTLSKNTRPVVLIYLVLFITILTITDTMSPEFNVPPDYIELFKVLITGVSATYFGARSIEKVTSMRGPYQDYDIHSDVPYEEPIIYEELKDSYEDCHNRRTR